MIGYQFWVSSSSSCLEKKKKSIFDQISSIFFSPFDFNQS